MFSYFLASRWNIFPSSYFHRTDRLASIGPTAGAPLLGFGDVPISPISVIDFHGLNDRHIPYNLSHAHGEGPHGTVISSDGYYYHQKAEVISRWAEGMECGPSQPWPTHMDGAKGWQCTTRSGCIGGLRRAPEGLRWAPEGLRWAPGVWGGPRGSEVGPGGLR